MTSRQLRHGPQGRDARMADLALAPRLTNRLAARA